MSEEEIYTKTYVSSDPERDFANISIFTLNNRNPSTEYIWIASYQVDYEGGDVIGAAKTIGKAIHLIRMWLSNNSYADELQVTETELY